MAHDDDGSGLDIPNGNRFFTAKGNRSIVNFFNPGDIASKCHGVIRKVYHEAHLVDGLWLRTGHRHRPIAEERADRRLGGLGIRPSENSRCRQRCM